MRDLDSAVGRLDNILMSVYVVVAILIIAVALVSPHQVQMSLAYSFVFIQEAQLVTLITGAGSLFLGTCSIFKPIIRVSNNQQA